ncbi:MAG: MATE family efflux transporter [Propionicimonas sp.]|uniref:MATE family efflux transporter n=1 Tax=Propionicimonas sp. TaxID=1955623 RepID=UPI003D13338A
MTTENLVPTRDDRYYLMDAPLTRALVHLAVPMMAAVAAGMVYSIINAGFIGSLGSTPLLAAITFGLPLTALVMAVGGVFGTGGSSAVSRYLGELENATPEAAGTLRAKVRAYSAFTVWGAALAGVVVAVLGLVFLHPLVALLGASGDTAGPTAAYVGVLLAGTPVLTVAFAIEQLVRSEGAARASMIAIIASTVANLVLDVLLILVLHLDVTGAGLAIVLSNVVTVGYLVWYLHRKSPELRIGLRWFRPDLATTKEVFGVGVSELLMSGFLIVSSLVFNNVAMSYGDSLLAAFGVAQRIVQLPESLAMGVALGAMPLIATTFGAGRTGRSYRALAHSAAWVAVIVAVFALPLFVFGADTLGFFSTDPAVLSMGATILTALLVSALFNGFTGLAITWFQATGQAGPATILSVTQGVLFVPVLFGAHAWFGLTGTIWAITVSEVACFAIAIGLFVLRRRATAPSLDAAEPALA